ncbi:hypothetical protein RF55_9921 [Lasius niger]|uniref:BED-type domain-containing protein n=1 Tax=Lasius niger TaxID=67767 RepID=A0A0J7NCM7_LASNI|nr:hypothetical protein RF55_9921 [Lasius niger]
MGRKKDKVWVEFKINEEQDDGTEKKKTAICNYCNASYSFPNATRMNKHLAYQCSSCPEDIKQSAIDSLKKTSKNEERKRSENDRSDIIDDPQTKRSESDQSACASSSSSSNGNQVVAHKHSVMSN